MTKFQIKSTSGELAGQKWPLAGTLVVGADISCEIILVGESIAPQHAQITTTETSVILEALQGEAMVNGTKIQSSSLGSGDEIRIGNHRFMLQAPGLRPQRVLQPEALQKKPRTALWVAIALAAIAGTALAIWQQGMLPF